MAFRKKVFEMYGGFRTDLGPQAGNQIRNEDTEFGGRLISADEHLRYEPSAIAYHPVSESRVRKDFFLAWHFDYGRATVLQVGWRPKILGISRRNFSIAKIIATVLTVRTLRWVLALNPQRRFFCKCFVWMTAGQIVEIYRQWGSVNRKEGGAGQHTEKSV